MFVLGEKNLNNKHIKILFAGSGKQFWSTYVDNGNTFIVASLCNLPRHTSTVHVDIASFIKL
jgi:hypothetical protein